MARPVSLLPSGGAPYVSVTDGPPATPVNDGSGPPVTLVTSGAPPICLVDATGAVLGGLAFAGNAWAAWDFINNEARYANNYEGVLANTPGWTFSRASTGYAQNAAGVLVPFSTGQLRRTDKGVLIEGARTNLCLQSQALATTPWLSTSGGTGSAITATNNYAAAPDGTTTATRLQCNLGGGTTTSDQSYTAQTLTGTSCSGSFYIKTNDASTKQIYLRGASATTVTVTGSWTRFTFDAGTLAGTNFGIGLRGGQGTPCSDTCDILIWGAQLEAASFPSSYVPTTAASAARAADVLTVPVSGIESAPLSAYAEFTVDSLTGTERGIFSVDDGAGVANIGAYLYGTTANAGRALCYASGATQMDAGATALTAATVTKLAMRAATNDGRVCQNGTLQTADTSLVLCSTLNKIAFGARYWGGGSQLFGYLRRCALWTRALSDSELTAVTST